MNTKNILFVANNPGGLRAMLPVIRKLPESIVAITPALQNLLPFKTRFFIDPNIHQEKIEHFLKEIKPEVIVTGTSVKNSSGSQVENRFRLSSQKLKIPSISILDHWCNYSERFTLSDQKKRDALPDLICVMDHRAHREMIAEGFKKETIKITGQPAFDELFQKTLRDLPKLKKNIRKKYQTQKKIVFGFISEPVKEDHGWIRGYDEESVLEDILGLMTKNFPNAFLWIKLHPREPHHKYDLLLKKYPWIHAEVIDENPYAFVAGCDYILGMTSILLLQAKLLGLHVTSYQPRIQKESVWGKAIHPLPIALNVLALKKFLSSSGKSSCKGKKNHSQKKFYHEHHATENVLKTILTWKRNSRKKHEH